MEALVNEDKFNMELRKFLKKVGITSQREIEHAVHQAIDAQTIQGNETINAHMLLRIDSLGINVEIDGTIELE